MDEQRKYAILFAATLLATRKLMPLLEEEDKPNMATKFLTQRYVKRAIEQAADILDKIDERWPRYRVTCPVNGLYVFNLS